MSWIRSDTDGILDKCAECGAHAGWRPTINGDGPEWSASCTDCPNQTPFVATKFDAAVLWNKAQRKKSIGKVHCPKCGVPLGVRKRVATGRTYLVHENPKGHKGRGCASRWSKPKGEVAE